MVLGCQTCLRVIVDSSEALRINVNTPGAADSISLQEKLLDCVPELILDTFQDIFLCKLCVENLLFAYEFKQKCLEAQEKIYGYLQQVPNDSIQDGIGKIAVHYQRIELIAQGTNLTVKNSQNPEPSSYYYNCRWCEFSCLDKCILTQHEILHVNKRPPYKCSICSCIFPATELLLEHLAGHFNETPYGCTICDFVTCSKQKLKVHGWTHRKAFQCMICWNRFTLKSELDAHAEIHNDEREKIRYCCCWCDFKTDSLKELNVHNHGKNYYKCKMCLIECRTEIGLQQHIIAKHEKPKEEVSVLPPVLPCSVTTTIPVLTSFLNSNTVVTTLSDFDVEEILTKKKKKYHRNKKRIKRVRIFTENGEFTRVKKETAIAMGLLSHEEEKNRELVTRMQTINV